MVMNTIHNILEGYFFANSNENIHVIADSSNCVM